MVTSARRAMPLAVLLALVAGLLAAGVAHAASTTLSGRISTTASDASLKGVQVSINAPDGSGGWDAVDYVLTRADGTWSSTVEPGTYRVGFSDDRGRYVDSWFRSGSTVAAAADVVVGTSGRGDVDTSLSPRGRITGTVTLAGTARRGVTVTAYVANAATKWFDAVADTTVADDGTYSLPLPPGTYRLGFSTPTLPYGTEYWKDTPWLSVGTDVVVGTQPVTGRDADLARLPAARGTVTDAAGSPLEGALVVATSSKGGTTETRTAADGSYALGLVAGTYTLAISADDHVSEYYDGRTAQGTATPITIAKADVALRAVTLDRLPVVSGTVRSASGALDGVEVSAYAYDTDASAWFVVRTATTGTDGAYRLPLPTGTYRLGFDDVDDDLWRSEFWNNASEIDTAADIAVATADVTGRDVTLDAGDTAGEVRGLVTDAATGRPVEGAAVDALRYDSDLEDWTEVGEAVRTTASGAYSLRLPRGDYRLRFAATGYTTELADDAATPAAARSVTVGATPVTVDASLTAPRGSLSGRVSDADGAVAGLAVTAIRDEDGSEHTVRTGSDGRWRVAVPDGTYTVRLDDGGLHRTTYVGGDSLSEARRVSVAGSAVSGLDAVLGLNPTVRGRVADTAGSPVASALVSISGEDGEFTARTATDGRYVLPAPAGDYLMTVTPGGAGAGGAELDLTLGSSGSVRDVTLPTRPRLSGRVTTSAGRAASGVRVTATTTADDGLTAQQETVTDADGRWSLVVDPEVDVRLRLSGGRVGLSTLTRDLSVGTTSPTSIDSVLAVGQLLAGSVTAPRGDEATVRIYRYETSEKAWETYGDDLTTTDGTYELPVPAGRYRVRASHGERSAYVGGSTFAAARDITVASGAVVVGNDIAFPLPTLLALRPPTVAGIGRSGLTLSVDPGQWSSQTASLAVQWLRDGTPVSGATARAYTLGDADQGATISARVTASGRGWQPGTATTSGIAVSGAAPRITSTGTPVISGTAAVGSTLTTTDGGWSVAAPTIARQWLRDGQPIERATGSSYTLAAADRGATITARVTAAKDGYVDGTATTAATTAVAAGTISVRTAPAVTGRPVVDGTLTTSDGTWSVPGVTVRYQWLRGGQPITSADGPSLTLGASDEGSTIAVRVTASKDGYTSTAVTPAASGPVVPADLSSTERPRIVGTARVGETLSVTDGAWSTSGVTVRRQWLRDGQPISGATGDRLDLTAVDVGSALSVRVTGSRPGYSTATVDTVATAAVAAGRVTSTSSPTVIGSARMGETLSMTDATWSNGATTSARQWLRSGQPIAGATGSTYTVGPDDVGSTLSVRVTGSLRGYDSVTSTSAATAAVPREVFTASPNPTIVDASGVAVTGSLARGRTLSAQAGAWSPTPSTLTYQWLRNGRAITGATARDYVVATADLGARLSVAVTGARPGVEIQSRTSSSVTVGRTPASVAVSGRGGRGTVALSVTVSARGVTPTGRVQVKVGSRVVKTLTLTRGKASVRFTRQAKGRRTFTIVYLGDTQVSGASRSTSVKVS